MCFTSRKLFWGRTDFTAAYLKIPQNQNIFRHWLILGHGIIFCSCDINFFTPPVSTDPLFLADGVK